MEFKKLGDGPIASRAAKRVFCIDAALTALTTLLDANEPGTGLGKGKGAHSRRALQTVHGRVDGRHRDGRAPATLHLFIEVTEHNAWCRQNAWSHAHDFGNRDIDIAISDYSARANNHCGSNRTGFKAPASDTQSGYRLIVARKSILSSSPSFSLIRHSTSLEKNQKLCR